VKLQVPAPLAAKALNLPIKRIYDAIKTFSPEFEAAHVEKHGGIKWLDAQAFVALSLSVRHIREQVAPAIEELLALQIYELVYQASRNPRSPSRAKARIYVLQFQDGLVKIGFSRDVQKRQKQLESLIGIKAKRTYSVRCRQNPTATESGIHQALKSFRVGSGEFFELDFDEAVAFVKSYVQGGANAA
jgi:T5orf172 domain